MYTRDAREIRDIIKQYFNEEGASLLKVPLVHRIFGYLVIGEFEKWGVFSSLLKLMVLLRGRFGDKEIVKNVKLQKN
ncbi:hypothetical protein NQ315_011290 [Exocentrus adspersus]|uniref:Uncharacterized protein n=1 Tax=Exocentrus adspersus TaxID=1586481 RepID=A0AAV8VJE8_9CUCU|nr:hypothetical protein NQ315_011290 [Exocentrus adspersus]